MASTNVIDHSKAVLERYSAGAKAKETALCCPVSYDPKYLAVIPIEVIEKDYGCGDPSRYLREGEVVLDLGSGGGKACFIASQIVGPSGRVIGVDANPDMLALARQYRAVVAERVGWDNVEFKHGHIEDLALDLDVLSLWLSNNSVSNAAQLAELENEQRRLRARQPLIADGSVDVVISNCVMNLVRPDRKATLFDEIYRVTKPGGRVVISDIVSDEQVPKHLLEDPTLWSGCISGSLTELDLLRAFERVGFQGIELLSRSEEPWQTVEGIEFRSVTVQAFRVDDGPCLDSNKAVIYRGPWSKVHDDDGHTFRRGHREAVCEKTFQRMMRLPYAGEFEPVIPRQQTAPSEWPSFDCNRTAQRTARESKGADYDVTVAGSCSDGTCC